MIANRSIGWAWGLMIQSLMLLVLMAWTCKGVALCASVKIEIVQTLTLERQVFDAYMKINNGVEGVNLQNVNVAVYMRDAESNTVTMTTDPNNTNALFYIRQYKLDGINNITGQGTVQGGMSAEVHWLIIPSPGAGGTNPRGQLYYVGATLQYRLSGVDYSVDVTPDYIYVKPMPSLTLDYFLPINVYGDDPFTEPIEEPVPFSLGVRARNVGHGSATKLKIESSQPRIVDNKMGLLVGFKIEGSEVQGKETVKSLLVDFGTIDPGESAVARWIMTCTLSGFFSSFEASFEHADELGGKVTSLINAVNTHQLLHEVLVDLPGRDNIRDFLAQDGADIALYESHGLDSPVTNLSTVCTWVKTGENGDEMTYRLTTPTVASSALYVNLPWTNKDVKCAVRWDGKVMNTANVWTWKERTIGTDPWTYHFSLFDVNGGGSYDVTFVSPPVPDNVPPVLQYIGTKVISEGQALGFLVHATDLDGTTPSLLLYGKPTAAEFTDQANGWGQFYWQTQAGDHGVYPVRFVATDGQFADWEIVKIYVGYPGEPLTNGLPVSLADWEPEIKDLWASSYTNLATVWWDSIQGMLYELHSADNPFAATSAWQQVGNRQMGSGTADDLSESLSTNALRRYYRMVLAGETPDDRRLWGVIRADIRPAGFTLISPPLRTDRRFDGQFGAMLAETLEGNNAGLGSGADEVYVLQTNGAWRLLYLDGAKTWREADGQVSALELLPGQGFWVAHRTSSSPRATFTGPVGNDGSQTLRLIPGWNLIGLSEGKDLPLVQTLARAYPVSGGAEANSDQLVIQNPNGTWRRLMYVQGWGAPYDGNWFDLNTFQIVSTNEVLLPGRAYYYLRKGSVVDIQY